MLHLYNQLIDFLTNLLILACSDPISFILSYKFVFLAYSLNIGLALYFSRFLKTLSRFYFVFNSILFLFLAQIIKLLAKYLNGL